MENIWYVSGAIGLAAFVQSVAGFGFGLVAIAFLPLFLPLSLAIPLVLLMSFLSNLVMWIYHRASFELSYVVRLMVSALLMIPIGLVGLQYLTEETTRKVLGEVVVLYVAYDITRLVFPALQMPLLSSPRWAYLFGGTAGLLTGAFTTPGPPLVLYANSKGWSPEEFKGNLPAVYVVAIAFTLCGHFAEGHLTPELARIAFYCLPMFSVGVCVGILLSQKIDVVVFKRIVLVLLGVIGLKLIW